MDSSQFAYFNNPHNDNKHHHHNEDKRLVPVRLDDLNESSEYFASELLSESDGLGLDSI